MQRMKGRNVRVTKPAATNAVDAQAQELARVVASRLKIAREKLGFGQRDMAKALGISLRAYSAYERGEREPRYGHLWQLVELGVQASWLFGKEDAPAIRPAEVTTGGRPHAPEGFVLVPRYDIEASAGGGALAGDENVLDYMAFQASWVRRALRADPSRLALITASGDSMEPAIRPGDLLLVDMSVETVMDDSIYLVALNDFLLVKRVQKLLKGLVVKSDNPNYMTMTLSAEEAVDLRIRGRIRWIGRLI